MRLSPCILALSLSSAILAEDFPLANRAFLFVEGGNKNAFGILEDVSPRKVVFAQFLNSDQANLYWANLDGLYFSNTLDIASEIQRQFMTNVILGAKRGNLLNEDGVYWNWEENLAVTAKWTCKEALQRKISITTDNFYSSYGMSGRVNGVEKTVTGSLGELASEKTAFDDRPDCWLERTGESVYYRYAMDQAGGMFSRAHFLGNSDCSKGWCALRGELDKAYDPDRKAMNEEVYDSVGCLSTPSSCKSRFLYDTDEALKVNSPSGLYILHFFPQVLWRPRNVLSGGVHAGVEPVPTAKMRAERAASLHPKAGDDPITTGWRSPLVDQQLSTMLSVQFRAQELRSDGNLVLRDPSPRPKWDHNPPVAVGYRFLSQTLLSSYTIAQMLLEAFAFDRPSRYAFVKDITNHCGQDWANVEKTIGNTIYGQGPVIENRVNQYVPYCYASADDEAKAMTDGREKLRLAKNARPCVLFSGNPISGPVKRWKLQKDPLTNTPYDVSNFIWRGCPDGPTAFWRGKVVWGHRGYAPPAGAIPFGDGRYLIASFLNRNQLLDELATPYERCNPVVVANACRVYDWIYNYAKNVPNVDWSGQIADFADKRRKTACPDVAILKRELAAIKNPALYPTQCRPDPYTWSVVTWPDVWMPTYPMVTP